MCAEEVMAEAGSKCESLVEAERSIRKLQDLVSKQQSVPEAVYRNVYTLCSFLSSCVVPVQMKIAKLFSK